MNTLKSNTNLRLITLGLMVFSFMLTSCTSLQQSTTVVVTDDLYDLPSNKISKKVEENSTLAAINSEENYQQYENYQDDRYLRLKVANRNRWSMIDDWGYWNDPRYNNSFYPSYLGWNSWYTGYYGNSWFQPFGGFGMGWGGYNPFMSSFGYGMWGYDNFGFGGFGGFGYGGYGGFGGFGGFGNFGWNPYFGSGFWNPYASYYGYGNIYGGYNNIYGGGIYGGGIYNGGGQYQQRIPVQPSRTNLNGYVNNRNVNSFNRVANTNGETSGRFASAPLNNGNGPRNINSATLNSNNNSNSSSFGSLIRRAVSSSSNSNGSSNINNYNRPTFSNNNSNNNNSNNNSSNRTYSAPSAPAATSAPASSGGGGFVGGGRRGGGK